MKIEITGSVYNVKGKIKIGKIIDLPEKRAKRLIDFGKAVAVEEKTVQSPVEENQLQENQPAKVKTYKQMNVPEQTAYISEISEVEKLEELMDETKATVKPLLQEKINKLKESSAPESDENTGEAE